MALRAFLFVRRLPDIANFTGLLILHRSTDLLLLHSH